MSAFAHCVYASSIATRMPSFGALPSIALGSRSSGSSVTTAVPFTRKVSPTPGIRKSSAMRGSTSRFVSVSAIRFPGRSGRRSVRSSMTRTKPAGSPRGDTSRPPSGRAVATQTKGEWRMNSTVRAFRWSATLAATSSVGEPISSRRCLSSRTAATAPSIRGPAKLSLQTVPTPRWTDRGAGAAPCERCAPEPPAQYPRNQPGRSTMPVASMRELLEAGVHFGHQTRRWNPKMRRFIFTERSGIYIIDLTQTSERLEEAAQFVRNLAERNGTVLFVGTKKQAQDAVENEAKRVNMPYVNHRWLGGLLTNWRTMSDRIERLHEMRRLKEEGQLDLLPAKERIAMAGELEKLEANLGGVADMRRQPDAVFIVDLKKEQLAVREARRLGLPVVALVDTNCDPDEADYVVPGNDDAIRSCSLITRVIADAIAAGQQKVTARDFKPAQENGADAPAEPQPETAEPGVQVDAPAEVE